MRYTELGKTGLIVSQICFGALGIGPLQAGLSVEEGSEIIKYAFEKGINFIDTAEIYQTYPHIAAAIKKYSKDIVVATKSYAYDGKMMKESFERARKELNRDYIDIFLLHEQESEHTLRGHWEAFEYLLSLKGKNLVRAVGISTHHIAAVKAATLIPEIDIIHPIINITGLGIADGTREEMETAIKQALIYGKGVYGMKALGGGNLIRNRERALEYAFKLPVHSVALGMKSKSEVDFNIFFTEHGYVDDGLKKAVTLKDRRLHIEEWCQKCGCCVEKCSQQALTLSGEGIEISSEKCLLCGYCASVCKDFCIKII